MQLNGLEIVGWDAGIRAESRREARGGLKTCRLDKDRAEVEGVWLGRRDSNPNNLLQRQVSYR